MATHGNGDRWLNLYRSISITLLSAIGGIIAYLGMDMRSNQAEMLKRIGEMATNVEIVVGRVNQNSADIDRLDTTVDRTVEKVNVIDNRVTRIEARP